MGNPKGHYYSKFIDIGALTGPLLLGHAYLRPRIFAIKIVLAAETILYPHRYAGNTHTFTTH